MGTFFSTVRSKWRALLRRSELDASCEVELQFHLEEMRNELLRAGVPAAEADCAVRRRFGSVTRLREECGEAWAWSFLDRLRRDALYAWRLFVSKPGLTSLLVAVLAFGIGATTAIFSVMDGVLLRPLPYAGADRLYLITENLRWKGQIFSNLGANSGNFELWRQHSKGLSSVALLDPQSANLYRKDGSVVRINGVRTTASLFPTLGVKPLLGHFFTSAQDRTGTGRSVVLTYPLWKQQFGGDPHLAGQTIRLDGYPVTVAAVLPASFYFPKQTELSFGSSTANAHAVQYFISFDLQPYQFQPGVEMFNFPVIARVRAGVNAASAIAELNAIETQVPRDPGTELTVSLTPLKDFILGPTASIIKLCFAGVVLLLLLIWSNVAGLLLSRSLGRAQELALRVSVGAERHDLLFQFATEGLLLSVLGGTLGAAGAYAVIRLLVAFAPANLPRVETLAVDVRFFAVCVAVSVATGLVVSLVPAMRLVRVGPATILKAPSASGSKSDLRAQKLLTAGQVAVCTVLLICACLLAESLAKVLGANRALLSDSVLTTDIDPPPDPYSDWIKRQQLMTRLTSEAASLPGVTAAGVSSALPSTGETWVTKVRFKEYPMQPGREFQVNLRFVTPGYTRALGLSLIAGRHMFEHDLNHPVVLISRSVAERLPANGKIVGSHFFFFDPHGGPDKPLQVVGIVEDVRATADQPAPPTVYVPDWEWPPWNSALVVRTNGNAAVVAEALRATIRRVDPRLAFSDVRTIRSVLNGATASRRYVSELAIGSALSAALLAVLGVYGLASLAAAQRTREIGIRVAMGARPENIISMLLGQSLLWTLSGLAGGLLLALAFGRLLTPVLYETRSRDPILFATVACSMVVVSLLAGGLPVRRALRVDPVGALKYE